MLLLSVWFRLRRVTLLRAASLNKTNEIIFCSASVNNQLNIASNLKINAHITYLLYACAIYDRVC